MSQFARVYSTLTVLCSIFTQRCRGIQLRSETRGDAFSSLWRQRQLEYTWTRSLMNQYADFWEITREALEYALESFHLDGHDGLKESLMNSYLELTAYPDVADTLQKIQVSGHDYRGSLQRDPADAARGPSREPSLDVFRRLPVSRRAETLQATSTRLRVSL